MKFLKTLATLAIAALVAFVATDRAEAMPSITLNTSSSYYLGSISNGVPSSTSNETGWLAQLSGMTIDTEAPSTNPVGETLRRSGNSFTMLADPIFADKDEAARLTNPFTNSGYYYALGKYGGGQSGITLAWVIRDLVGYQITLQGTADGNGLSHISFFGPTPDRPPIVPDGGSTVILMGLGTLAIGFLRGRQSK